MSMPISKTKCVLPEARTSSVWPRGEIAPYLLLLLAPTLLMIGPLGRGEIPNFMDPLMYFYPLRVAAARILAQGEWPLWNRGIMAGVPLFENPQAALSYPLVWPFLKWPC